MASNAENVELIASNLRNTKLLEATKQSLMESLRAGGLTEDEVDAIAYPVFARFADEERLTATIKSHVICLWTSDEIQALAEKMASPNWQIPAEKKRRFEELALAQEKLLTIKFNEAYQAYRATKK